MKRLLSSPIEDYIIKDISIMGISTYGGMVTVIGVSLIIGIASSSIEGTGELIEIKENMDR